jgi:hypothetical protein
MIIKFSKAPGFISTTVFVKAKHNAPTYLMERSHRKYWELNDSSGIPGLLPGLESELPCPLTCMFEL